jgi:hypothetical protein
LVIAMIAATSADSYPHGNPAFMVHVKRLDLLGGC